MNKLETFEQYFATSTGSINIPSMILALFLAALLSYILGKLYIKYGSCLSNRAKFAGNFMILTTTTTLIISVVKSSLALSLGLVGALSIIRFRAAIKEPEELAFLFLTVSVLTDGILDPWFWSLGDWEYFIEDGAKWLGIASWCSYYVQTSYLFIIKANRSVKNETEDRKI